MAITGKWYFKKARCNVRLTAGKESLTSIHLLDLQGEFHTEDGGDFC
jgi:hypothetical protein